MTKITDHGYLYILDSEGEIEIVDPYAVDHQRWLTKVDLESMLKLIKEYKNEKENNA